MTTRPTIPGLSPSLEINTIFCIGRNYAEHAKELNSEILEEPVAFLKPVTSIIFNGGIIFLPGKSNEVHHEVELVAAIGREGKNISREDALEYVAGYGIGIDVTARDLQNKAKQTRGPWSVAKGFDTFAPISNFIPPGEIEDPQNLDLRLEVNGEVRQQDNTENMIFPVDRLIAYLSGIFTLRPGDLIFTGTPAGVSSITAEDRITATLNHGLLTLDVSAKTETVK